MLKSVSVAVLALLMVGCASSDKSTSQLSSHWSTAKFGAPAEAGLSAEASQSAANARILADVPAKDVNVSAVVVTARSPLYEAPSTSSRLLGTIAQGGAVNVEQALLWYRLPDQWHGGRWGEQDGRLPTWAKVDARGVTGYMPWRCLGESLKDPGKVERGALAIEGDALESSRKNFSEKKTKDEKRRLARATKGMAGGEIASADPDFESIDAFLVVSGRSPLPAEEANEAIALDLKDASPAEEFFVGRLQAAKILGAQPAFDPDHPVTAYVRSVGSKVAASSTLPRPYGDWVWVVVEEPDELNAFALSGGFVFITTGMLEFLQNEDEMAAVLAHEIAHVEQGHPVDAAYRLLNIAAIQDGVESVDKGSDEAIETTEKVGGLGSMFGFGQASDAAAKVKGAKAQVKEVDEELGISETIAQFIDAIMQGYDQPAETEADGRGITLTAAAGYDPRSMAAVISRMIEVGVALPESHYSPKRKPQVIQLTEVFLQPDPQGLRPDLTPQPDTAAAANYRAIVGAAMQDVPPASADSGS
jgi:hypothetical protein